MSLQERRGPSVTGFVDDIKGWRVGTQENTFLSEKAKDMKSIVALALFALVAVVAGGYYGGYGHGYGGHGHGYGYGLPVGRAFSYGSKINHGYGFGGFGHGSGSYGHEFGRYGLGFGGFGHGLAF